MSTVLCVAIGAVLWVGVGSATFRILNHFSKGDPGWLNPGPGQIGREGHAKMGFWLGPLYACVILMILAGSIAFEAIRAAASSSIHRKVMGLDRE